MPRKRFYGVVPTQVCFALCADFANPRAALEAARLVFTNPAAATAPALWSAAQHVLQLVLGRPELTGQALVGEVRRHGLISLSDAHALVGLSGWADRSAVAATNEAERMLVREAWMALDHAVPESASTAASFSLPAVGGGAAVPPLAPRPSAPPMSPPAAAPSKVLSPVSSPVSSPGASAFDADMPVAPARSSHRKRLYAGLGVVGLLVALLAGGAWWYANGRANRRVEAGIDAYARGARETARVAFVEAVQADPNDARPLIYLGRISREEGDRARARRFLTNAVRVAPSSSIAARELASVMLADGQPEIARRFYVRAIELDPNDRTAQGFLGCALVRLQRLDEARRWTERAGPGDWQRCVPLTPMSGAPTAPPGYGPVPPP
ncbi:tetratricopeptide repeat protein [Gemmatimonas sp.]|uniref:tetratricopeptide repeat protein n=1 Tax=Gemmatimonas sp. TaxID=1962908 RepID=UPI003DA5666E